ncbi:hypothetical protein L1987_79558 [Smallanthus sonchifolius]|uniref:Uncharacterized protein n=1 Tax=Smallanthus sonchifolius TaxID=185202 RepID=A0ACB8ZGV1_9ASTR|nr:hypothetical protein L1987_79558 [Smallanthus sonchifolius]
MGKRVRRAWERERSQKKAQIRIHGGDPFDLDRFILRPNSSSGVLPQPQSQVNLSPRIPDLNSIMGGSSSAATDDISSDSHVSDTPGTTTGRLIGSEEAALNKEVEATIGMGK